MQKASLQTSRNAVGLQNNGESRNTGISIFFVFGEKAVLLLEYIFRHRVSYPRGDDERRKGKHVLHKVRSTQQGWTRDPTQPGAIPTINVQHIQKTHRLWTFQKKVI